MSLDVYLRDFSPATPYPPGFTVPSKMLDSYLAQALEVRYKKRENQTFVNYPTLFGKAFSNVWFEKNLVNKIKNHDLYCISCFLNQEYDEYDFLFDSNVPVLVYSVDYPLSIHVLPGGSGIGIR